MRFHQSKSMKQSTEPITLDTIVCTEFWRAFNMDINFWTGVIASSDMSVFGFIKPSCLARSAF